MSKVRYIILGILANRLVSLLGTNEHQLWDSHRDLFLVSIQPKQNIRLVSNELKATNDSFITLIKL